MAGQATCTKLSDCFCPLHFLPKVQVHYCDNTLSVRPSLTFYILNFSFETAERNSTKLVRKQDVNVLYQVCVFRANQKNKMVARHTICWDIFDFSSSATAERNWQEARSQCHLRSLCFRTDWKNKMAAPACDWLRHFRLLLWHRWTEFNETW